MQEKRETKGNSQKFVIDICCRENHTWQGSIHWVNENKKEYFRSVLEMIRLIDSAMQDEEENE